MASVVGSLPTVGPSDDVLNLLFDADDGILINQGQQQQQQQPIVSPDDFGEVPDCLLEQTLGSGSSSNDSSESLPAFDLDSFLSCADSLTAEHSAYELGGETCGPVRNGRRRKRPVLPYTLADCDDCDDLGLDDFGVGDLSGQLDGQPGQPLALSGEELRLAGQMGVQLPDKFPLTREEQRALRTIRRKIRNKISAKNSRAKRQEYVRGLEIRAKTSAAENAELRRRCTGLEQQNRRLMAAMRRLNALFQSSGLSLHAAGKATGTGVFVFCLSFALFIAPQFSLFGADLPGQSAGHGRVVARPASARRILELPDTNRVVHDTAGGYRRDTAESSDATAAERQLDGIGSVSTSAGDNAAPKEFTSSLVADSVDDNVSVNKTSTSSSSSSNHTAAYRNREL